MYQAIISPFLYFFTGPTYSITFIQRPLKGTNESGLFQQVVFQCRFYYVDLRRFAVSEQLSLKAGGL